MAQLQSTYITGSLTASVAISASSGFTGSFTGSHTGTFPYASLTGIPGGIVSSSTQVAPLLPTGTVSSSAQYPGWVTSSTQVVWSSVNYNSGILSSSTQFNALTGTSASYAVTASYAANAGGGGSNVTSSLLTINSETFTASGAITNFALSQAYTVNSLIVSVDGLEHTPTTDYTMSGSTLVFTSAPPSQSIVLVRGFVNVTSNATGSFSGSFKGDGSGLVNINAPVSIDNYSFAGDGVTKTFTVSQSYSQNSVFVAVAGLSYTAPTDYTVTGSNVVFVSAPPSGSNILIKSWVNVSTATGSFSGSFKGDGSGLTGLSWALDTYIFTGSGATTTFALSQSYTANNTIVTLDGLTATAGDDYTITGTTLTITPAPVSGSTVLVRAYANIGSGTGSYSGSLAGTATSASFATTASYATTAATASNLTGGTANYIPLWSSATAQSASSMYQLTGNIGINNTVPSASLHISGSTMIQQVVEKIAFTGSAPIATTNIDITSGSIHYRSGSTSTNWTLNFRGDASTTLNSIIYPNQSLTVAVVVNHGATPYSASAHQIDGVAITPRWQGSLVPTASANTTDFYSYTIFKLASASYNVFASQVKFS